MGHQRKPNERCSGAGRVVCSSSFGGKRKENEAYGGVKNLIFRGLSCIPSLRRFEILAVMAHFQLSEQELEQTTLPVERKQDDVTDEIKRGTEIGTCSGEK